MAVVGGGDFDLDDFRRVDHEFDWVISADAGTLRLLESGIQPHLAVGDFDTTGDERLKWIQEKGIPLIHLPVEKAMTDLHYAIQEAIKRKPMEIFIFGALGGARIDHALANIGLLEWIDEQGVKAIMVHRHNRLRLLAGPAEVSLKKEGYTYVSLIPVSKQVEGITTHGMLYPLHEGVLIRGQTLGISNEIKEDVACIQIRQGKCLLVESSDA
ncbi:thiamine diphosphokinase [Thermoflavimicrobium dichotomicum]|uniref:thiamine diphosphokinase n=1 Tax=Thermoflavimicrobium dichotomicum TaxID=46223 RepID=UPI0015871071|nr:thiamine diphosphokinase [Thermoflavimicrobium dichotomicum]